MRRLLLIIAPLLVITGCASQVAALAPVGGDDITAVRFAAIDVLLAKGVAIMQAPVCTEVAARYTCSGTTTDGAAITVTAGSPTPVGFSPLAMTLTATSGVWLMRSGV